MDMLSERLIAYFATFSPELLLVLGFLICMIFILIAFRYFGSYGLVCYSVVAVIIANLQVLKMGSFSYVSGQVPLGTIVFTTLFTTSDLITEHYGAALAKRTIYLTFLIQIFVILSMMVTIAHPEHVVLHYPGINGKASPVQVGLNALFTPSSRLFIASIIAFMVSQHLDISIFSFLKKRHGKNLLWLRVNLSTFTSGLIDNFIFSTLVWITLAPEKTSFTTVVIYFVGFSQVIRVVTSLLSTPLLYLSYRLKAHDL